MRFTKENSETDINRRIEEYLLKNKITPADFSKQLGITPSAIYAFLKSNTCDVDRLWEISKILGYNFFAELAGDLKIDQPLNSTIETQKKTINELQNEIKTLQTVIKLMTGKEV